MHVLVHYSYIEIAKLVSAYLTLETVISSNFEKMLLQRKISLYYFENWKLPSFPPLHSQGKPYIFVKIFIHKNIFLKNLNKILSFAL